LKKASDSDQQALNLQQQLGERGSAAESQLALAQLTYDSGRAGEAETLARAALSEFQAEREPVQEIAAEGLIARTLLDQNKVSEAEENIADALKLSEKTPDVMRRLALHVDQAYVLAASQKTAAAEAVASQAMAEALRLGLVRIYLEASLAMGRIQTQAGKAAAGKTRLEGLAKEAQAKGFALIAREASAASTGTTIR
jgi:hypothetical protein